MRAGRVVVLVFFIRSSPPLLLVAFSDNPLEVFFDLVPTGAALYAPVYDAGGELVDFRFARLNPAGQRLLGLPAQPPRTFREYYPTSVPTGIFAQYRTAYLTGQATTYDVPYKGDGLDTYFRLVAQRSGELLVVNFTDMADLPRSAVEQALRDDRAGEKAARVADAERQRQVLEQERATFYQVFEMTPAAICIQRGPEHRYAYANQAYQDFFPGRVLLGQSVAEVLPETVDSGVVALLDGVYQTGETYHGYELPLLIAQPTGPPRQMYFTFTYQALRENGEIVGISTFAYDVAEQVQARNEREAQRQRLFALFEQAPVGICILSSPSLTFEFVNPGYQQLLPEHALLGRSIFEVLPEIEDTPVAAILRRVYATGEMHEEHCLLIPVRRPSDGVLEERYFTFVYQAERGEQGHITGVLAFVFEATEQERARQQVQRLNQELQASNEELGDTNRQLTRTNVDLDTFVYTASHDLKAPISNIESIITALRETLPPAVQQAELVAHLLGLLDQTVARFQFTITQLTDISKLQLAHAGSAESVPLAQVVEGVRLDLAPAIQAADTQLTVEVDPELVVSFSPANLRSVVYNLLSNAVKYCASDRPSQVQVHAEQTPYGVVLTVQDNGLGMSAVQQRQLFGLFQRLHTHVEGTGVGLYISKRLIENAGGTIAVRSQPDQGTTFTVTFPA